MGNHHAVLAARYRSPQTCQPIEQQGRESKMAGARAGIRASIESRRVAVRRCLVGLVLGAGALGAAAVTGDGARASGAAPHTPIRHVVLILQENHSFDNVLGLWCVVATRCDGATAGTLYGGTRIALSPATDVVPWVQHTERVQTEAIDGGLMDGFSLVAGCGRKVQYRCYSQYAPTQIPNAVALASRFAVSDRTFEDGPVPSWGSHLETVAATLDGFAGGIPKTGKDGVLGPGWGCDSGDDGGWTTPSGAKEVVPSCVPDPALPKAQFPYGGAYKQTPVPYTPTIMDRLEVAGLSWRIYAGLGGTGNSNGYGWAICPTFAECLFTKQRQNLVADTNVIDDAKRGSLPSFSIVTPTQTTSQHNGESMAVGDNWIGSVLSAIEKGPDWSSTAVFLTWDDCGCFYDHVAPPPNLGIRVPMIIVSPYAIAGHTDHETASYASVLAFTEHVFGLPPLAATDASAYDYAQSFSFKQAPLAPVTMVTTSVSADEQAVLAANRPDPSDPT
jgi:phospholipase C